MKKKTIKWVLGVIGLIFLGAIGSGLWQIGIQPIFDWVSDKVFSTTTLGFSLLSDAFYRDLAKGFHEESSVLNMWLIILVFCFAFGGYIGDYLGNKQSNRIEKELEDKIEKYKELSTDEAPVLIQKAKDEYYSYLEGQSQSYWRRRKILIIFGIILLSFIMFREFTIKDRNRRITAFNQIFTICKPYLNEQEEEEILASFAAIKTRQDLVSIIDKLVNELHKQADALIRSYDTQKKTK